MKLVLVVAACVLGMLIPAFAQTVATPPQQVTVKLSVEDWQTVMNGLNELKVREAMPVIDRIQAQARDQLNPPKDEKKK